MSEGLVVVGHQLTIVEAELTAETETPDATVLLGKEGISLDGKIGFIGLGGHIGIEEHMTDGIGIGMGMHEVGVSIAGNIGTLTIVTKTPTKFIPSMLGNDTALASLPAAGAIDIPTAHILILKACLVGDREVAHLATVEDTHANIALSALRVDAHLTSFCNTGITVVAQHHADVELMQLRTGCRSEK